MIKSKKYVFKSAKNISDVQVRRGDKNIYPRVFVRNNTHPPFRVYYNLAFPAMVSKVDISLEINGLGIGGCRSRESLIIQENSLGIL